MIRVEGRVNRGMVELLLVIGMDIRSEKRLEWLEMWDGGNGIGNEWRDGSVDLKMNGD